MFSAIDASFEPNRSKHSDRHNKVNTKEHVYSYKQYNNLKDLASNFSGYCKENGVKKMGKLNPEIDRTSRSARHEQNRIYYTLDSDGF